MLHEQLCNAWHWRERAIPISPELYFAPHGLVLGAGTVLIATDGPRRLAKLGGLEARVLALLAAAYDRPIAPRVLGNIERAAKAWSEGDDCLAYIHLAHASLPALQDPHEAARRLFMADGFMKAGTPPRDIIEALDLGEAFADRLEKFYNEQEPRVPKGSGRPSGQWTRFFSFLADLSESAAKELGRWGLRLVGGAVAAALTPEAVAVVGGAAAFGLIFIPSNKSTRVQGEISGLPGLRYSWNRDETQLHLTYDLIGGGQRTYSAYLVGDEFRDEDGRVIGRLLPSGVIVIDVAAALPDLLKKGEPKLCPKPVRDKAGSDQGKPYELNYARQFEDFAKMFVNPPPDAPTPSGFAYELPNPKQNGEPVSYDDCQKKIGIMFEFKGLGYAKLSRDLPAVIAKKLIKQAKRQIAASGGRDIVWIFAEQEAAEFAQEVFDGDPDIGRRITIMSLPWKRKP